jgi:hypothetical protein
VKRLPADLKSLRKVRESVLRALSLVVTDRRWAAPLSAMALGFGLFLGVAIGPGAAGSLAGDPGSIVAVAPPEDEPEAVEVASHEESLAEPEAEEPLAEPEAFEPSFEEPALEPAPVVEPAPEEEAPPAEEPAEEEASEAQQLKGTVVHANPAAGSYTMAIAGDELVSVHAAKLPKAGEKLSVEGVPLPNNTFAEEGREKAGSTRQASIRGVVTWVSADPAKPAYAVSGRGASILVQGAVGQLPALGAYATVGVQIEATPPAPAQPETPPPAPEVAPTCAPDPALVPAPAPKQILVQRSLKAEPEPATYFDLAGVVSAVCPATGQLLISADDTRSSESDLLLTVPPTIKTAKLKVGDSVVATATLEEGIPLTLTGLASDEGAKGAEDAALAFGDLKR